MKIFIGNLNTSANEQNLKMLFMAYGEITSTSIVYDNYTKRSRGCGCVEMVDINESRSAIAALNNTMFMQRSIIVREAEEKGSATWGSHY